jgi:hypothetical protein
LSAIRANIPSSDTCTPFRALNFAFVPIPFANPATLLASPTSVVTDLVEMMMRRIRKLFESATKAYTPSGEILIPHGLEN